MHLSRRFSPVRAALCAATFFGPAFAARAQHAYAEAGVVYRQDFNSLPAITKTPALWFDGETLPAWCVWFAGNRDGKETGPGAPPTISSSDGSASSTRLFSFGARGADERALGANPGATSGHTVIAFAVRNDTGRVLRRAELAYAVEQWRAGSPEPRTLAVDFRLGGEGGAQLLGTGWEPLEALSFGTPITAGKPLALDGNAAANRTPLSATVENLDWSPGVVLWLRFVNRNESGGGHVLALDDFTFSAR